MLKENPGRLEVIPEGGLKWKMVEGSVSCTKTIQFINSRGSISICKRKHPRKVLGYISKRGNGSGRNTKGAKK
jgi:hypothetical protein